MPIDPGIILATKTAQVANPIDSMAKIAQLRQMQENQQALVQERQARAGLLQQQQQQRQQAMQDQSALDTAVGTGTSRDDILSKLPGHMHAAVTKQWQEADEADAKAKKLKKEAEDAEREYFGGLAASVRAWGDDPQAAQIALQHAKEAGHDTSQIEEILKQQPDALPKVIDGLIQASPKHAQLAEQARAAQAREAETAKAHETEAANKAADNARMDAQLKETKRHNEIEENLAARKIALTGQTNQDPESVAFWVRQVQNDPTQWSMLANNKPLQQAVQAGLGKAGVDLNKLTAQSRAMAETAKELLPRIDVVKKEAEELERRGLMGPIAGKWRDLVGNRIGAESLVGGGENARLVGKFLTDVGLLETGAARAHGGARGGGSPMMLKHMENIMGAGGKDLSVFLGNLDATKEWMQGYASMTPTGGPKTEAPAAAPAGGPKATHKYNPATGQIEAIP